MHKSFMEPVLQNTEERTPESGEEGTLLNDHEYPFIGTRMQQATDHLGQKSDYSHPRHQIIMNSQNPIKHIQSGLGNRKTMGDHARNRTTQEM